MRTGLPSFLDRFLTVGTDLPLHARSAVRAEGIVLGHGPAAARTLKRRRLFFSRGELIRTDDQVDKKSDDIPYKNQQCPQNAVHSPPFGIPVNPDDDENPDDEQEQRDNGNGK